MLNEWMIKTEKLRLGHLCKIIADKTDFVGFV